MLFGYGFRAPPKSLLVTFYFSALGIPFKFQRPIDWRLAIAEKGQKILQDNLVFKHYSEHFYQMFVHFFYPLLFLSKPVRNGHCPAINPHPTSGQ